MNNKAKKVKIFLFVLSLTICILVTIYLFPIIANLASKEGQLEFKDKIGNLGVYGVLMLFGLQFAQMFLFVLPGEPIEILAGMCYGYIWGTVFLMISAFIISAFIFWLVKKIGKKFVYEFCNEERVKKIENSKLFQNPKKIEWIMIILFMIPGTPKDLLTFAAGLLPLKPLRFLLIATFARFPSVISSTIAGANLVSGNVKSAIISYAITFLLVGVIMIILDKTDKNKLAENALKSIK